MFLSSQYLLVDYKINVILCDNDGEFRSRDFIISMKTKKLVFSMYFNTPLSTEIFIDYTEAGDKYHGSYTQNVFHNRNVIFDED